MFSPKRWCILLLLLAGFTACACTITCTVIVLNVVESAVCAVL